MESGKAPAKKICTRKFRKLDENIFKGWLAQLKNNNKAFCKICNILLTCSRYNLLHAESAHIDNVNSSANVEIDISFEETVSFRQGKTS